LAAFISNPYPGAKHGFSIFRESASKYIDFLEKGPGEENIEDPDRGQDRWALLADKGYVSAEGLVRALYQRR
jgi:hypothetical protein